MLQFDDSWSIPQGGIVGLCALWAAVLFFRLHRYEYDRWVQLFIVFLALVIARSETKYFYPDGAPWLRFAMSSVVTAVFSVIVLLVSATKYATFVIALFGGMVALSLSPGLPTILFICSVCLLFLIFAFVGNYIEVAGLQLVLSFLYTFCIVYMTTYWVRGLQGDPLTEDLQDFNNDLSNGLDCFHTTSCVVRVATLVVFSIGRTIVVMKNYRKSRQEGYQKLEQESANASPPPAPDSRSRPPEHPLPPPPPPDAPASSPNDHPMDRVPPRVESKV